MGTPAHNSRRVKARGWLVALALALSGCTQFPDLDAAQTPGLDQMPFPKLVPLDGLKVETPARATVEVIGAVEGRVAGLQARADRLRTIRARPTRVSARLARLRQKAAVLRAFQ